MVRAAGIEPASSEFQARSSTADLRPDILDTPTGLAPASTALQAGALLSRPRRELGCRAGTAPAMEAGHSGVRLLGNDT